MEFFISAEVVVFTGVLLVVAAFAVLELILTSIAGVGFSDLLGMLIDTDSLPDSSFTNWLFVKDLPLMISVMAACAGFGVSGMALHGVSLLLDGLRLPGVMVYPLAALGGMGAMHGLGKTFKRMKVVHTTALQPADFIGRVAVLLSPDASRGSPGEAKFTDQHGQTHYVMVQPVEDTTVIQQGERVVLRQAVGAVYDVERA